MAQRVSASIRRTVSNARLVTVTKGGSEIFIIPKADHILFYVKDAIGV